MSSGLFYDHNTFMGIFIDIDNDSLEDLVVAHDTGHVKTWKNLGNNKFKDMPNPNSNQYSYPMGIAVTDLGNDGDSDFFILDTRGESDVRSKKEEECRSTEPNILGDEQFNALCSWLGDGEGQVKFIVSPFLEI